VTEKVVSCITALLAILVFNCEVSATSCRAEAEFVHAYPANSGPSKFKIKFRVSSYDCKQYSCNGFIKYRIHYQYTGGDSNSTYKLVRYRVGSGQTTTEVTDETYPSYASDKVTLRDIEVSEVSCSSP
jgi:hypothetical protein